jgi:hypothetical protein
MDLGMRKKLKRFCVLMVFFFLTVGNLPLFCHWGGKCSIGLASNSGIEVEKTGWFNFDLGIKGLFGYSLGLLKSFAISKRVVLQVEALYSVKGDKGVKINRSSFSNMAYSNMAHYHYLEVPIIIELFPSAPKHGFHLLLGGYASLLLKATETGWGKLNVPPIDLPRYDQVKPYDFGILWGIGFKTRETRQWQSIVEFRIEAGMVNIGEKKFYNTAAPMEPSSKNFSASISFGICMGKKKSSLEDGVEKPGRGT